MSEEQAIGQRMNLPATVETPQFRPIAALGDKPEDLHEYVTNFDGKGLQAAVFITQTLAKPGLKIDEMGGQVFHCRYYLAHVAEFVSDKGEVEPMPRMVLIGPNGESLSFVSDGGIRSMDLIRSLCGNGPWNPPLPISVIRVKTRRGFTTYRLVLGESTNGVEETSLHGIGGEQKGSTGAAERQDGSGGTKNTRRSG